MARRSGHRRGDRWYGLVVALIAAVAFVATLNLPVGPGVAAEGEGTAAATPAPARFDCDVAAITDGDTLRCADGTRVRLHALAARERDETCSPGHPCPEASGAAATAALRRLAGGLAISCERTGRSYDRITAVCWTPAGEEINCAMLRSGTVVVWDRYNRQRPLCQGTALS
ncbi:MAG: nuclease [Brevundimonas sp.]|uniref:thermonuclease family protein n=1 Tax=Brevundimonas sp. TaxID=1871086 RepID=UPI0027363FAD|nr:nuclease [Brevundimonas sp.]MDP3405553.1 nuclease [Brevundimonas sp.]